MPTKTAVARSLQSSEERILWDSESPLALEIETRQGDIQCQHGRFVGGYADGVEVVEISTEQLRALILPTRGMSVWKVESRGVRFGWDSPISGPVHPDRVPVFDPRGLGWLEGFDEFVVRCGLESNGAPEHDGMGRLVHPLHGRIGNLPADSLSIEFSEASGRLDVIGEVIEARMFQKRLKMRSRIRFQADSPNIELLDDVTNELSTTAQMQLLYHINVGSPVLGEGAEVHAAVDSIAPRDALSASEIETWHEMGPPESGYQERVYYARLRSDESHLASAMLRSPGGERGLAVTFNTAHLTRFNIWKNTAAESDGYVMGLEPATNFPNERSFESDQGRVVSIAPGDTVSFRVTLHPLTDSESVEAMSARISDLQGEQPPEVHAQPRPGWSPGA